MIKLTRYDTARYLDSEEMVAAYIAEILSDGSAREIALSIETIARARGMTQIAKDVGISREKLYAAVLEEDEPSLLDLRRIIKHIAATTKSASKRRTTTKSARKVPAVTKSRATRGQRASKAAVKA